MAKRKEYDLKAIEEHYCAGLLSLREIGRQYGCSEAAIRKWAANGGWTRDLAAKIRKRAHEKLVRKTVRKENVNEEEIVESNSEKLVEIQELMRNDIAQLRAVEEKLLRELSEEPTKLYLSTYKGTIVEKVVGLTVAERSMAANNLANVQHKRIALERQAWGMDASSNDDNGSKAELTELEKTARIASLFELAKKRLDDDD